MYKKKTLDDEYVNKISSSCFEKQLSFAFLNAQKAQFVGTLFMRILAIFRF